MDSTSAPIEFARLREQSGLELSEAAEQFGVELDMARAWETGQVRAPEPVLRTLAVLADFSAESPIWKSQITDLVKPISVPAQTPLGPDTRDRKAQLGQFMTARSVARFMAGLFNEPFPADVRLVDPGAGRAALTNAFVERWEEKGRPGRLSVHAYECDAAIVGELRANLASLSDMGIDAELIEGNFIATAAMGVRLGSTPLYTHAILNPPYKKIGSASAERAYLRVAGLETVNLYSGFVWLALQMLETGGELVAIIPRSFCNGPYYEPFRQSLLNEAALIQLHLFAARDQAFKRDKVLQENVIIHLRRGAAQGEVLVSTSRDDSFSDYAVRPVPFDQIVLRADASKFIHIPVEVDDHLLELPAFRNSLSDIGIEVSTGPVVDFRLKADLRLSPQADTVPLLYPGHFAGGVLEWPRIGFKKPNAIVRRGATEKWLYPAGYYTVVRRFSSKEERRRIVANVVEPDRAPGEMLGFENHLNVFHSGRAPLSEALARGLAVFLNATTVDRYFRRFNGHTQVNATDLRMMRYPDLAQLESLGHWASQEGQLSQEAIDHRVGMLR